MSHEVTFNLSVTIKGPPDKPEAMAAALIRAVEALGVHWNLVLPKAEETSAPEESTSETP